MVIKMMSRLKDIYQEKFKEEVKEITKEYYYFYKNQTSDELFAITKTISSNEYQLLKEFFIEKQIYDYQAPYQAIYEYLLENKAYPFHHTRMRMVIFSLNRADAL